MQQSARLVPRWIAAVLWVAGAVGLFALIGFVILPPIIKSLLTNQLSERLHRSVSIQEVEVNPFRWSLKVSGFVIREPGSDERFVSFEQLDLNVDAMSLIRLGPVVSEVAMDGLFVSVIRHDDLTYNLSDLLDELASGREPEEPDAAPLRFSINNIRLTNGGIDFHDRPKHISHTVRDMDLRIPFLSNMPKAIDIFTTPAFSATVNGTPVAFQGQTKPFNESLATEMNISLTDVAIPAYVEYLPRPLTFALPSAALDSHLTVSFRQYTDRKPALVLQGILLLKHVVIKTLEDRLVSRIPHLAVTVDEVDVFDRTATVESIVLEKPEFHARRDRSGTINFTTLGMTGEPKPEDAANESRRPTSIKSHEGSAFRYRVREFTMRDAKVTWTDATTQPSFAATLAPVTVTASHLTNQPGESADVTLGLTTDAGETLRQQGTVTLEPLSVNGTLELRGVPITRYAPYYSQGLPGTVKAGTISARLQYRYEADPENVVKTLSDLSVSINGLRLIQPGKKEDFLKIPHLSMTDTQVDLVKRSIEIGEVATINGRLRMERAADGTIDLAQLAGSAQEAQGKGEAPADRPSRALNTVPPWAIELKKLRLEQYAMTVRDLVPKAPATFHIEPVNLVISRLSTATNTQAELSAKVTMNPAGRLSVNGTVGITPVAASLHVNLRELALVPFQPYLSEKMRVTIAGGLLATEGTLTVTQETAQPVIRYSGQAQVG
ncbi:MAG TPA: DUF748 domain-containing protein, partial [Nitrospira sp.]|nr:DUF748 domain-containing protein [Nitrospira sp.]